MPLNNKQDKVIYRTLSIYAICKLLVARLVLATLIISGIIHLKENPVVITIVVGLLTLMLLYVGNENIIVYESKFVYQYGSLIKSWAWSRKFYYRDIERIECDGIFTKALNILTDRLPVAVNPYNKIHIMLKDGNTDEIRSRIYKQDLKKAMQEIKLQLEKSKDRQTAHNTDLAKKRL